jgi:hypothetical protein
MVDAVTDIHITFATGKNVTGLWNRASEPRSAYSKDVYVSMDSEKDFIQRGWERIWSNFRLS